MIDVFVDLLLPTTDAVAIIALWERVNMTYEVAFVHSRKQNQGFGRGLMLRLMEQLAPGWSLVARSPACFGWVSTLFYFSVGFSADIEIVTVEMPYPWESPGPNSTAIGFTWTKPSPSGEKHTRDEHLHHVKHVRDKQLARKSKRGKDLGEALIKTVAKLERRAAHLDEVDALVARDAAQAWAAQAAAARVAEAEAAALAVEDSDEGDEADEAFEGAFDAHFSIHRRTAVCVLFFV